MKPEGSDAEGTNGHIRQPDIEIPVMGGSQNHSLFWSDYAGFEDEGWSLSREEGANVRQSKATELLQYAAVRK